jgi:ABC-2 type transport system ATP-binding protein
MIEIENLAKSYGRKQVLRGLSMRVRAGEITLLVGANGAGKTTTIKILAGLLRPGRGQARVQGFDVATRRIAAQRTLAYLPQNPSFHPRFSCLELLRFYARLRGIPMAHCRTVLEQSGLDAVANARSGTLSGGTRQRLGIALLLLADAPVLLLDEPGLSLDPGWRSRLQERLQLEARRGKTVLLATHLIAEWNGVANRCLLCRDGLIERELDPNNLPDDFEHLNETVASRGAKVSGGAGVSRVGSGVLAETNLSQKVHPGGTPSPARETPALPKFR